ncbi:MAG: flagellar biosynthetic protein FliO [Methylobacteriaceae bacterium]|nr:flagellar biosynthetic protein FliO [Methylobacteriaceae bacterium]
MSLFGENRTLAFVLAAVCLLIGVALVFVLFRIVFGRGIKLPGGRSRQQRLGIVDAFEIDRQRQLVIVRRDNVEHLLMIGGPNDVVVEASIIRAEAREGRPIRERETPAISGLSWPAGPAATEASALGTLESPSAARSGMPEPPPPPISILPPPSTPEERPEPSAAAPSPLIPPPRPVRPPPPPLRTTTPGGPARPPRPPLTPLKREPRPLPPFLTNRGKPPEQTPAAEAAGAPEALTATPQEEPAPATPPETPSSPAPAAEGQASPPPSPEGEPSTAPKIELDPLESLEEEMAKLLGRPPSESR